jgi:hypothetical protein
MKEDYVFLNKEANEEWYQNKNIVENVEMILYSLIGFLVPFLLGHPQIIVGIIVNASLILAALSLKESKMLPVIIMPSIGVLCRGLIFGPYTPLLIYMIPFIWIGNALLAYLFKTMNIGSKVNSLLSLLASAAVKTAFLFLAALFFVNLKILPTLFLTTMGMMQLYTALAGGAIALAIFQIRKKFSI